MINRIFTITFIAVAVFSCQEEETVAEMRQRGMIDAGVDTPYIEDQAYRGQDYLPYRVLSLDSFACADAMPVRRSILVFNRMAKMGR